MKVVGVEHEREIHYETLVIMALELSQRCLAALELAPCAIALGALLALVRDSFVCLA